MIEKPSVVLDRERSGAGKGIKIKGLTISMNPTLWNVVVTLAYLKLISSSSL